MEPLPSYDVYLEALQRSEKKYRSLIDRSYLLLFILHRALNIRFVCESVQFILHQKPVEVTGRNFFEAFRVPKEAPLRALRTELSKEDLYASRRTELSVLLPGGSPARQELYFDCLLTNFLPDPDLNGFVLYLHNVTERKRAEEELRRLNFELDSFVYKASHDMRAPLLNLLGLLDIAQRDFPLQALEYMDLMKRSVLRLDRFILDLTEYSRNDRTEVEQTPVDLAAIVQSTLEDLQFLPNATRIRFLVEVQFRRSVASDPVPLKILLNNLISNAIKYHDLNKKDPFVRVTAREEPARHTFVVEVQDNGTGIVEHFLDKVFDMFFRATDRSEGSGLGLYIVKKVVEKMGGKIELKTKYKEGTTFTIYLPDGS
jgi:PAS domain S-box-containing protein